MSNIGLIVAMGIEVPDIFQKEPGIHRMGGHTIHVVVSGIGRKRARRATEKMCKGFRDFHPDYVMSVGLCGGTRDDLDIGHLIVANRLTYRDREIALESKLLAQVVQALQGIEYHVGKLQMVDWPALSRNKVAADVLAVDMESFAIADTARNYHTPVVVVKAVSDIVPIRAGVSSLLNLVRFDTKEAKSRLDVFTERYFS